MKNSSKLAVLIGLISLMSAISAVAQITNRVTFETTFPFYVGNAKMPAGAYTVTQPDQNDLMLLFESPDGSHSAYADYIPTTSENPHAKTDVTFNKYGKTDFLNLLWVQGQDYGMQVFPTRSEQAAAKAARATRHSVPAK